MISVKNRTFSKEDLISYKESQLSQLEKVVFFAKKLEWSWREIFVKYWEQAFF